MKFDSFIIIRSLWISLLIIALVLGLTSFSYDFNQEEDTNLIDNEPDDTNENDIIDEPELDDVNLPCETDNPIGEITIKSIGSFNFNSCEIITQRSDIFKPGHFSVYDILFHLHSNGEIKLESYFDESRNTHFITAIDNAEGNYWYTAYYDGGWPEGNSFRMDLFPYKEKMTIEIFKMSDNNRFNSIRYKFLQEVERLNDNSGNTIIPEVQILSKTFNLQFTDVNVTSHNLRSDLFQPNVITAIDVIMSLGDQGKLAYELKWYDSIGSAGVVRNYFVHSINRDTSSGTCGYVYEAGSHSARFNHIHIPSDARIINNPEYVLFYWICL